MRCFKGYGHNFPQSQSDCHFQNVTVLRAYLTQRLIASDFSLEDNYTQSIFTSYPTDHTRGAEWCVHVSLNVWEHHELCLVDTNLGFGGKKAE